MPVEFPSSPETFKWSVDGRDKTRLWMCCHCGRRNVYSAPTVRCCERLANIPEFRSELDCSHERCSSCTWKWSPQRGTASPAIPPQSHSNPAPAFTSHPSPDPRTPIFGMYPLPPPLTDSEADNFMAEVERILAQYNKTPPDSPSPPPPQPETASTRTPPNESGNGDGNGPTRHTISRSTATASTTPEPEPEPEPATPTSLLMNPPHPQPANPPQEPSPDKKSQKTTTIPTGTTTTTAAPTAQNNLQRHVQHLKAPIPQVRQAGQSSSNGKQRKP